MRVWREPSTAELDLIYDNEDKLNREATKMHPCEYCHGVRYYADCDDCPMVEKGNVYAEPKRLEG